MGLFDGQLVTVTTPDGRQVQMPSDLAASFPTLQPLAQPAPVGGVPDGDSAPALDTPAAPVGQPTQPPLAAPITGGPVILPSQVPDAGQQAQPQRGPVTMPGEDQGAQQVAPTPALTKAQLLKEGPAGTLAQQNAALDKEAAANDRVAQINADTATKAGAILADRDAKTQKILDDRARVAQENVAELQKRITARDALADQIANTRVDRSIEHPIMTAIGLILSAAGTAMKLRPGEQWNDPAYNILQQQLDRKVDLQMKNLDIQRQALAQMNVGITEQRQLGMDRIAEVDVRKDAAIQQAQQMVETMATQMKSPLAKAQAQALNAKLDQERAALRGQAAERIQAQVNTERAQAQAAQFHRESMDLQRQQMAMQEREKMAALAEKVIDQKNAAADKAKKDVAERGVWDPRTGNVQLDPEGQKKLAQADQIEAQARQNPAAPALEYVKQLRQQAQKDPDAQKRIDQIEMRVKTDPQFASQAAHEYAQTLRADANANNAVLAPDKATADKVRPVLEAAQGMTDEIDQAVKVLESGPSGFDRQAWAGLKTKLSDIAVKYAKLAGERVSVKAVDQAMENIISFDPDSFFSREASKGKAIAALKSLQGIVTDSADSTLRGAGIKSNWVPVARSDQGTKFDVTDKTASEIGQEKNPGFTQRLGARILTGGLKSYEDITPDQESAAPLERGSEAGLSANATTHVKALAARAELAGDKERTEIVNSLKNAVADGLGKGERPTMAYGVLDVLSSANPTLYKEVVDALPELQQKQVRKNEAFKSTIPAVNMPAGMLMPAPEPLPDDVVRQREFKQQADARARAQAAYTNISRRASEGQGY